MINDVGKTSVSIRMHGCVINMFNTTVASNQRLTFLDENDHVKFNYTVNEDGLGSRALFYTYSFSADPIEAHTRPVLFIPPSVAQEYNYENQQCVPLHEVISPSLSKKESGIYQLTWWTNTTETFAPNSMGVYEYDYSKIKKFYTATLEDIDDNLNSSKLLCTAPIIFDMLKCSEYGDSYVMRTPIIQDVAVVACISGEGYIVDFSTGGGSGGGGNKIHSHLNTQDCGFAGAVFMPSATPRVMSWM